MFWSYTATRIKVTFRCWESLIWTLAFPIGLATMFFFAFARLDSADVFAPIPSAVVADAGYAENAMFRETLAAVSAQGEDRLLDLREVSSAEEANALLDSGDITGYFTVSADGPRLAVKADGLNQTILKSFLDSFVQSSATLTEIARRDPAALPAALEQLGGTAAYTRETPLSASQPSSQVGYFFALLAMVCLYGSFQGQDIVSALQGNLSPLGARRCLSPVGRMKMVAGDLLGGFAVQAGSVLAVLAFILLVLRIDFGTKFGWILLTCLIGSLLGLSLGALVTAALKLKAMVKNAILVTVSLVLSFMAGLMVGDINYVIAKAAPAVAWLNPAARISDAFYCLYYYDNLHRFSLDILVLLAMTAILLGGTVLILRRQRYADI